MTWSCLTARSCRPSVGAHLVARPRLPGLDVACSDSLARRDAGSTVSGYAVLWTRERIEKAVGCACHYRLHVGYAAGWLVRFRRYRDRDAFGWQRWLRIVLRMATSSVVGRWLFLGSA